MILIFQNLPKFEPKLAQIKEILEKSGDFTQIWTDWYMNEFLYHRRFV